MHFLWSPFLWIGIITLVFHCFGACPILHATLQIRVNQRTLYIFIAFNISGLISSSPGAFPVFNDLIAAFTSASVIWISSPTCSSWICVGVASTGFKRSLKYSLYRFKVASWSFRVTPFESSIKKAAWDLFLHANSESSARILSLPLKSSFNLAPNFLKTLSLDSLTLVAAALRASEYSFERVPLH